MYTMSQCLICVLILPMFASYHKDDEHSNYLLYFLAVCLSMWDLSPPTRDQTHAPCSRKSSLNH